MGKRLPADVDARIVALRDAHKTEAQIAAVLKRDGVAITASGVHRALGRLGRAKPRKGSRAPGTTASAVAARPPRSRPVPPPSTPAALPEEPEEVEAAEADLDVQAQVRRALAALERAALRAEEEGDVARVVAAHRAVTQAAALAAKLTPPPAVTLDDRPDMAAAAQRGRERLRALITRALGGGAT